MVDVFRTNVDTTEAAAMLVGAIQRQFMGYKVNFDLDDCDRILRIESISGCIEQSAVIELVKSQGFIAEVLMEGEHYDSFAKLRLWIQAP